MLESTYYVHHKLSFCLSDMQESEQAGLACCGIILNVRMETLKRTRGEEAEDRLKEKNFEKNGPLSRLFLFTKSKLGTMPDDVRSAMSL